MKNTIIIIITLFISSVSFAGFESSVIIKPSSITTNTNIEVGINLDNAPCLVPILTEPNDALFMNGNQLELVIVASTELICNPLPFDNPIYHFYSIGQLNAGVYNLQVRVVRLSSLLLPFANDGFLFGEVQTFGVDNVVIPALNNIAITLLIIFILFVVFVRTRKNLNTKVFVLLVLVTNSSYAEKVFHIILSSDENAPTPEAVVFESMISPPPKESMLSSFTEFRPNRMKYLLSDRPEGDLRDFISAHPKWTLSKLYRYIVLFYDDSIDETLVKNSLQGDIYIDGATFISTDLIPTLATQSKDVYAHLESRRIQKTSGVINSYLDDLGIQSAWELSEGSGYIGVVDTGIEINHPAFKTFDLPGNYIGGNILEGYYSTDFGEDDLNVDEKQPVPIVVGQEACQDPENLGFALPSFVGHGTHVAGVLSANNNVSQENGICKNCGLSVMKYYKHNVCRSINGVPSFVAPNPFSESNDLVSASFIRLSAFGIGVISYSGGIQNAEADFCNSIKPTDPALAICLALTFTKHRNTLLVTSAGNNRASTQFPASDVRTIGAGGINSDGLLWNESPSPNGVTDYSDPSNCPYSSSNIECGSTHSFLVPGNITDVVTQAKDLYSTFYTGAIWSPVSNCTDDSDGINDGNGFCTGTSMSAPQTAAITQLMRSTHPLLPNGNFDPSTLTGITNVLNATATPSQGLTGHDLFYGYGMPNARKALEALLGKSNGVQMKNRLTPMFAMYSSGHNDHLYTSFPQVASAFLTISGSFFIPDVNTNLVNEFTDFWYDHNDQEPGAIPVQFPPPRAAFYVFTTNNNPFTGTKNLVPLRRMDKDVGGDRNDTYAVSNVEIKTFHDNGYNFDGIEGYILPVCTPMPSCIPTAAIPLYRDEADNLNHKLVPTFTAPLTSTLLGYVYLNQDTDGDGLIDGQEIILGTNINVQDTDSDTVPDGVEYPPAGVPYSDPRISDIIFKNSFE